jgi:hypothetical protein
VTADDVLAALISADASTPFLTRQLARKIETIVVQSFPAAAMQG